MMQAMNPYSGGGASKSKAEILARYRPIAPKPEPPSSADDKNNDNSNALPESLRKSAFLRDVWPHLQARPTRTRKRGRTSFAFPALKRPNRTLGLSPPPLNFHHLIFNSSSVAPNNVWPPPPPPPNYPTAGLPRPNLPPPPPLPLLKSQPHTHLKGMAPAEISGGLKGIDLNRTAAEVPEEFDFMPQLLGNGRTEIRGGHVITPQPVRLVASSVFVGCIIERDPLPQPEKKTAVLKRSAEDVEKEVEAEALPVVVSDVNNKVRLSNSAYKEMVGQPECRWLDYFPTFCKAARQRMIGGEVVLRFMDSGGNVPNISPSSTGFTCWVRIEWGSNGKKNTVRAFCDAVKLACHSKDYLFEWRFHTKYNNSSQSPTFLP